MRSVFVFVPSSVGREGVAACLDRLTERKVGDRWEIGEVDPPLIVVSLYEDYRDDFEDEDLASVTRALGVLPAFVAMMDVSGRVDGYDEASRLVEGILVSVGGVAQDDHSSRCWSARDIARDRAAGTREFFSGGR